jgi:hypothetical protein
VTGAGLALTGALVAFAAAACDGPTHALGVDCLPSGTDRELQAAIDARGVVVLCPRAVFTISAPVVLRQGLTLETAHRPTDRADMATLVLAPALAAEAAPIVGSGSDIHLTAVRFDGNRRTVGRHPEALVRLGPGDHYTVEGCAFTDAPGWTHLHVIEPCDGATIVGNRIESAPRPHDAASQLSDGLSISCAHALIEDNDIADASGVGIVYFGGPGTVIRGNTIALGTTSASSGINVGDAVTADHTGVTIEGNTITAAGDSYLHIGIAAGLHAWEIGLGKNIRGVAVRDNTVAGMSRYGLTVDGCVDCQVQGNDVRGWLPWTMPLDGCPPPAAYIASVTNGHAGGTLQPGYLDATVDGCRGPIPP